MTRLLEKEYQLERTILSFDSSKSFESWLEVHHAQATGIWIRIAKKGAPLPSITYPEALDVALCYGWIDGQKAKNDESSWLQYFSRRRKNSLWSQVNRTNVARLLETGRLREPGRAAIEEAKASGRWDNAYPPVSSRELPPELESALKQSEKARTFFDTLNSQNRFSIVFRVSTAKTPETRQRRIEEALRMLENEQVHHPKKT